jgi:hypothetical protein
MKKVLRILMVALTLITSGAVILFAGCTAKYENIYNDDNLIISYNSYGNSDYRTFNSPIDGLNVSSSSFSGVETVIYAFTVNSNTSASLYIDYSLAGAVGGKIKVVLADNYNVFVLGECGKLSSSFFATGINENLNFNNIPDGVYSLKIVGVNAHFEMWFSY